MPLCYLYTNLKDCDVEEDLEERLQECIAGILQKPVERITIIVNTGVRMTFGGKKQPGMICHLHSIKVFDEDKNRKYFPPLFKVLTDCTRLPAESITIALVDLPVHMAMNGGALPQST